MWLHSLQLDLKPFFFSFPPPLAKPSNMGVSWDLHILPAIPGVVQIEIFHFASFSKFPWLLSSNKHCHVVVLSQKHTQQIQISGPFPSVFVKQGRMPLPTAKLVRWPSGYLRVCALHLGFWSPITHCQSAHKPPSLHSGLCRQLALLIAAYSSQILGKEGQPFSVEKTERLFFSMTKSRVHRNSSTLRHSSYRIRKSMKLVSMRIAPHNRVHGHLVSLGTLSFEVSSFSIDFERFAAGSERCLPSYLWEMSRNPAQKTT